jgi:hypothetical protein
VTTATAADAMTTAELNDLLHDHFIKPEDRVALAGAGAIYLTEVTAPGNSGRRADAVHIGLWQSRGAGRIDVCELKVSRSDFRRELDKPQKAEAWWPYSTTFSIVAPSVAIAPPEDLPPGWGLMVPKKNSRRFQTIVKPAEREPRLTISLLMTLLKNTETTRTNALRQQSDKLYREHAERDRKIEAQRAERTLDPATKDRLEALDRLEDRLGMKLSTYSLRDNAIRPEAAAEALRELAKGTAAVTEARRRLTHQAQTLERVADSIAEQAKTLRAVLNPPAEPEQP